MLSCKYDASTYIDQSVWFDDYSFYSLLIFF